jgi:phage terminase large subunit-like protein
VTSVAIERPVPEALAVYATATQIEHFAWWVETYCEQSIDVFAGEALVLEGWQYSFLSEALAVDEFGMPCWKSIFLVLPRKNGKTTLLAAFALYHLFHYEGKPEVLLAAASDKQAGRLFDSVVSFVRRSPYLRDRLHVRDYVGEIVLPETEGTILRMSSNPDTLHGYNPSLVVPDEIHALRTPSHRKAWAALTTGGGARRAAQVFGITTAGEAHERADGILGRIIDGNERMGECERPHDALTISRNPRSRTLVYNYSAPTKDPEDLAAIKRANPASWITLEYLGAQAANPELSKAEFLQLHANVWAEASDAWIPSDLWFALRDDEAAAFPEGAEVFVGVDVGITHDSTAIALARPVGDGRVAVRAYVIAANPDTTYHELADGGRVSLARVEEYVEELAGRYAVREVAYDPRFFERSAEALSEDLGLTTVAFEQSSKAMTDAYQLFYQTCREKHLAHNGDPVLADHVTAIVGEKSDRGWKVRRVRYSRRIDAGVAAVMAVSRALASGIDVYETRDLRVV